MIYVDLHVHSHFSDGKKSPGDLVALAKSKGLDMLAIADHDNIRAYFQALPFADMAGLVLTPNVELSTLEHHLLGLNFDPHNKRFQDFVEYSREIQADVCRERVKKLIKHGIPITFKKVKEMVPEGYSIGKVTILDAMLSDEDCKQYFTKVYGEYTPRKIFHNYLSSHGISAHVIVNEAIRWSNAVDEIHKAGGLAIFAHPPTFAKDPNHASQLLSIVDGVDIQEQYSADNGLYIEYAKAHNLKIFYGSDFHGGDYGSQMLARGNNFIDENILGIIKK